MTGDWKILNMYPDGTPSALGLDLGDEKTHLVLQTTLGKPSVHELVIRIDMDEGNSYEKRLYFSNGLLTGNEMTKKEALEKALAYLETLSGAIAHMAGLLRYNTENGNQKKEAHEETMDECQRKESLKKAVRAAGLDAVQDFLAAAELENEYKKLLLDETINRMPDAKRIINGQIDKLLDRVIREMPESALDIFFLKYGRFKPYYYYTGPANSSAKNNWVDEQAYELDLQKAPTGSIVIRHPDMEMMARVTDKSSIPGFLVTCKDSAGKTREVQVYFNEATGRLTVVTSNETDKVLYPEDRVRMALDVPFVDNRFYE